jgi:hypothetical protein
MFFPRTDCAISHDRRACDYVELRLLLPAKDNKEQAAAILVSKGLNDTQYKWSLLMKEAYAIFPLPLKAFSYP